MSSLLVLGAGGHGRVVADAAISTKRWDTIAFADDRIGEEVKPLGLDIVSTLADFADVAARFDAVALGIGNNRARLELYGKCRARNLVLPPIVHRSAAVSAYATIGPGSVVLAQAAVNPGACLGAACIVNTGATIDHDCSLADGVHVSPGANLAGGITVGRATWIGIGACVRQELTIGPDVIVGAGSVVITDVEPGQTVFGVPARVRR